MLRDARARIDGWRPPRWYRQFLQRHFRTVVCERRARQNVSFLFLRARSPLLERSLTRPKKGAAVLHRRVAAPPSSARTCAPVARGRHRDCLSSAFAGPVESPSAFAPFFSPSPRLLPFSPPSPSRLRPRSAGNARAGRTPPPSPPPRVSSARRGSSSRRPSPVSRLSAAPRSAAVPGRPRGRRAEPIVGGVPNDHPGRVRLDPRRVDRRRSRPPPVLLGVRDDPLLVPVAVLFALFAPSSLDTRPVPLSASLPPLVFLTRRRRRDVRLPALLELFFHERSVPRPWAPRALHDAGVLPRPRELRPTRGVARVFFVVFGLFRSRSRSRPARVKTRRG